jgi:hypothetical protein
MSNQICIWRRRLEVVAVPFDQLRLIAAGAMTSVSVILGLKTKSNKLHIVIHNYFLSPFFLAYRKCNVTTWMLSSSSCTGFEGLVYSSKQYYK